MNVRLHIDRLVLDGVALDRFEARRLQLALERMLAARFGEPALLARLRSSHDAHSMRDDAARTSPGIALHPVEAGAARIAGHIALHVARRGSARVAR